VKRREFITLLGGAAAAWPLAVHAQQPAMPVIGFLHTGSAQPWAQSLAAFRQGLNMAGYNVDQNLMIEYRWADGHSDRLPTLAEELVRLKPDVIVAGSTAATLAAKRVTISIPIVCVTCTDPVGMGLVSSEARPGTNVTGNLTRVAGLTGKQLELASEIVPGLIKIGVLINVSNPTNVVQRREAEMAADKLGLTLVPVEISLPKDIHTAFQLLARESVQAVLVFQDTMFLSERKRIALMAAAAKLPTVSSFREHVEDGGLLSYGIDVPENFRRAAHYVDRILKGEKAANLPMEFSTKFSLVINLIAAMALGVEISPMLLARADEVIE
jgi:putative ABC transport system substrate-binding protein